jgi:hypothetical protein
VGDVGSYAVGGFASDSPWLPGEPVTVRAGSTIRIILDGQPIGDWQASVAPEPDVDVRALGEGSGSISFAAPTSGRWSLRVRII